MTSSVGSMTLPAGTLFRGCHRHVIRKQTGYATEHTMALTTSKTTEIVMHLGEAAEQRDYSASGAMSIFHIARIANINLIDIVCN